jgi:CubicO group peptidase (beta-lactamase class C family)
LALGFASLVAGGQRTQAAHKQLEAAALVPSPVFDSGLDVPSRAEFFTTQHNAVAYRSVEETFPTRRIATSATASVLTTVPTPPIRYTFDNAVQGDATHSIDDFATRTVTSALLILHNDQILFEGYYLGADSKDRFMSFSAGKSFTSTLVALALGEGKIQSLNDPIMRYLPELKGSAYETATIKQVLQMATGTSYNEEYEDRKSDIATFAAIVARSRGGLYDFSRSFKSKQKPGTRFYYATANTEILGALVARVTGMSISQYMSEKLWQPLGAEAPARWILDADGSAGRELAGGGLQVRLRDYGRFGLLFANRGRWNGKQLLPAGWVEEATLPQDPYVQFGKLQPNYPLGYGYQWWLLPGPRHRFAAEGIHGQFILVDPEKQVVVVKLSAWKRAWDDEMEKETYAFFDAVDEAVN